MRSEKWLDRGLQVLLQEYTVLILDGGLATELERKGCDLNDPLWSAKILVEQPAVIKQVHAEYYAAGADVATTATYQATFEAFERRGLSRAEAAELMRLAVRLAAEARDEFWQNSGKEKNRPRPLVAASIGSYGAYLADGSEYRGNYGLSERQLIDFHRPRVELLASSEADMLACETIPCLTEALALAKLLQEFPTCRAWLSFSALDAERNCQGEDLAECLAQLEPFEQIVAVGVNCTAPGNIGGFLQKAQSSTRKPLVVYPNSGELYDANDKVWAVGQAALDFGQQAKSWQAQGAQLIGGCCRTTPADIKAVAQLWRA